jgi:hypothetical protein
MRTARALTLSAVLPIFALCAEPPTYFRDVLPILQTHCQRCHRPGEIARMPFDSYAHTRPYAAAIRERTATRQMPPWFADPCCGHFSNDPSLSAGEIATLAAWAEAHAPEGEAKTAPVPVVWTEGWNIYTPDVVLAMPKAKRLPVSGDVAYQYIVIPTHFTEDRWVTMSEIRPSNRAVVHHAVAYIRPPESTWLKGAPVGVPFSADDLPTPGLRSDALWTVSDILLVYAPGSLLGSWPTGFAKLIPAGSDIVLQMHYTTNGHAAEDLTSIGLVFASEKPEKRVLTVQLTNDRFSIPAGDGDYRVEVHGSIPNDALLLSFFPHMHFRGKTFEYNIVEPRGRIRTLLRIPHYDFFWQLSYRLAAPIPLKAGTILQAVATFDNSKNNAHNPDPNATVTWGEQTWAEMMVGFFDVAVDPAIDKAHFFVRH